MSERLTSIRSTLGGRQAEREALRRQKRSLGETCTYAAEHIASAATEVR